MPQWPRIRSSLCNITLHPFASSIRIECQSVIVETSSICQEEYGLSIRRRHWRRIETQSTGCLLCIVGPCYGPPSEIESNHISRKPSGQQQQSLFQIQ